MPFVVPPALFAAITPLPQTDLQVLLSGVTELIAPGSIPGPLAVFGENAIVVAAGQLGKYQLPVVAAARYERGKVVALGHEGFFSEAALANPDNTQFLLNSVRWVAPQAARVAVVEKPAVVAALRQAGVSVLPLTAAEFQSQIEAPDFDVVVVGSVALDGRVGERLAQALSIFVRSGGGVVMDSLGWGWLQTHPGQSLAVEHGGNKLFARFGIAWSDGYFEKTGPRGWKTDAQNLDLLHARTALLAAQRHTEGTQRLEGEELAQVGLTLTSALAPIPSEEPRFLPQVIALTKRYATEATFPMGLDKPLGRLKVVLDQNAIRRTPVERVAPHPSASTFPGALSFEGPKLNEIVVGMDAGVPEWHGVGLYAAAGSPITVRIPPEMAGKGLAVRIGAHTDTLWDKEKWERFPEVSLRRPIVGESLRVASPFGGTIYIEVPKNLPKGRFSVTVSGAVSAPRFVRGETLLTDWNAGIRNAPGPWAELEGKNVILTVPSAVVRSLDDPEALLAYWDEVSDLAADLYQVPRHRQRPERYVVDKQISAGYMHSGYPIMTYGDDIARRFVNLAELRAKEGKGAWGFYHELGHNHQRPWWTWDGCGEVTNNLLSLYCSEKLNNDPYGHPAMEPAPVQARLVKYLAAGAPYEQWKSDPFLALTLFYQLREAFGWDPFRKVFAEYEAAPPASLPRTDEQKRDQFLMRFSRVVNKNLGPFFTAWGVPTSDSARSQIARLPRWMPKDWPK